MKFSDRTVIVDNEKNEIHKQIKSNKILNKIFKKTNNSQLILPNDASMTDWMDLINNFDSILNKL